MRVGVAYSQTYWMYTVKPSHLVSHRRKISPSEVKVALAPALLPACAAGATVAAPPKASASA